MPGELARIKPGEVLLGDDIAGDASLRRQIEEAGAALTPCPRAHFDSVSGERALKMRLGVGALDAFGEFTRAELAALAGLLTYVEITQVGKAPLLRPPRKERAGAFLVIDAATRANLELVRSNQGGRAREPPCRDRPHGDRGGRAGIGKQARQSLDRSQGAQCAARCGRLSRR